MPAWRLASIREVTAQGQTKSSPWPNLRPLLNDTRVRTALTWTAAIASVLALLPVIFNVRDIDRYLLNFHIDVNVYREGALALLAGENLYLQDYVVGGLTLPFTYPPIAAIVFVPLALLPATTVGLLLNLGSAVLLWWCIAIVLRRVLPGVSDRDSRFYALLLFPLALATEPVYQTMIYAQVNIILMALVLMDTCTRNPRLPRGFWIGLAAAVKLTPAVFGLYFLVRRDWKAAGVSVASGVGFTLLAFLIAPASSLTYWTQTLTDPSRIGNLAYVANQSVRGALSRLLPESADLVEKLWLAAVVVILIGVTVAMLRVLRAGSPTGALALNSLIALLCSPVSWSHHWVWMIPLVLALTAAAWRHRRTAPGTTVTAAVLALLCMVPMLLPSFWSMPIEPGGVSDWPLLLHPSGSAYVVLGLAVVIVAAVNPGVLAPTAPEAPTRRGNGVAAAVALALTAGYLLAHAWFKGNDSNERLLQYPLSLLEGRDLTGFGVLLTAPLRALDPVPGLLLTGAVTVLALLWLLSGLIRHVLGRTPGVVTVIAALVITLLSYPAQDALRGGAMTALVLALVIADLYRPRPLGRRGLLTGIAAGIGGWPVFLILGLVLQRRPAPALTATLTALPLWLIGWLFEWRNPAGTGAMLPQHWFSARDGSDNVSLFAVVARWISDSPTAMWLWLLLGLCLGGWAIRNAQRRGQEELGTVLAIAWPALALPVVDPHLWLLTLPLLCWLLRHGPVHLTYLLGFLLVVEWPPAHLSYGGFFPLNHPGTAEYVGPWYHYLVVEPMAIAPALCLVAVYGAAAAARGTSISVSP